MTFRNAKEKDLNEILALYHSVIYTEFCTWNELYPSKEEIEDDYRNNDLYVMVENEVIIGALSVVPQNELDELKVWKETDKTVCEIARIVVGINYQGKGIAYQMVEAIMDILKKKGCHAIHLLVAYQNIPAFRTYQKSGFQVMGECDMFNHHYYACERIL